MSKLPDIRQPEMSSFLSPGTVASTLSHADATATEV